MTTSALKRRSFLQGSLLAAAVIGSTPAVAAEAAKPKFDESFDVIVVGSGIAGRWPHFPPPIKALMF